MSRLSLWRQRTLSRYSRTLAAIRRALTAALVALCVMSAAAWALLQELVAERAAHHGALLRLRQVERVLAMRGCAPHLRPETIGPWPKPEPAPCVLEIEDSLNQGWDCTGERDEPKTDSPDAPRQP